MDPQERLTRIIYIAGAGRSGGTILAAALGQHDTNFYGGEIRDLWRQGVMDSAVCGCGRAIRDCPVWKSVLSCMVSDEQMAARMYLDMQCGRERFTRLRSLPHILLRLMLCLDKSQDLKLFVTRLADIYKCIAENTGKESIIDASRSATYGLLLLATRSVRLDALQLVRDPRAVAYSWQRRRTAVMTDGMIDLPTRDIVAASLDWLFQNLLAEALFRIGAHSWRIVFYEKLMRQPQHSLESLARELWGSTECAEFTRDGDIFLKPNHSAAGNVYRTQTGFIALKVDTEWQRQLSAGQKLVVTALTWPLLIRYGYPLFS